MRQYKTLAAGFTLVEVAIVILIGGIMMTAASAMLIDYLQASRISLTQQRMQDIDNALNQYLSVNGILPCPASLTVAPDTATFGRAITDGQQASADCFSLVGANPGTLATAGFQPPVALTPANANLNIVIGAVPTRSLNLPDQEMADAWGSRFVYAVTDYLTIPGDYNPTQGVINIIDGGTPGNPIVGPKFNPPTYATYAVVSYGSDRAGAYTISGGKGTPCPANELESTNCNLPTNTFRKTMLIGNATGANYYDDYVLYHSLITTSSNMPVEMPSNMIAPFVVPAGTTLCPNGWQPYGTGSACTSSSGILCCIKQ